LLITSPIPSFLMMAIFIGMGYTLCRTISPYNVLGPRLLQKKNYYQELESMRGILALAVVIHHAVIFYFRLYYNLGDISGPNAIFYQQLGTAPVTMFFFTTGFLFWTKLIGEPKPPPGKFMMARLRRLGPAYLGAAVFMFFLVAVFSDFRLHDRPLYVVHDALRILIADRANLNGLAVAAWLWPITWTLKFEFLFYLTVPFLGWFARNLWRTLLFIAACNLLYLWLDHIDPVQWHFPGYYEIRALMRFFSYTFCIGFIAAHLVKIKQVRDLAQTPWAALLALAFGLGTLIFLPSRLNWMQSLLLALPFLAVAAGCSFWGILRSRTLLFLGQISYSVYLVHFLVYCAILMPLHNKVGSNFQQPLVYWSIVLLVAPLIILVSTFWNYSLELPFMGKKQKPGRPFPGPDAVPAPAILTTTLKSTLKRIDTGRLEPHFQHQHRSEEQR
jgi:peptidoglycan/LPS O-acetylase OafA/YrhL